MVTLGATNQIKKVLPNVKSLQEALRETKLLDKKFRKLEDQWQNNDLKKTMIFYVTFLCRFPFSMDFKTFGRKSLRTSPDFGQLNFGTKLSESLIVRKFSLLKLVDGDK